jgi:putative hydrolase of HD superfamily
MSLQKLLNFTDFLHKFRAIERSLLVRNSERNENDVEHSYSLAMLAWYLNETYKINLDSDKLFKYALAHDLVEVYAGDTYFYHNNEQVLKDKIERELEASYKIKEEFSDFLELHEIIEQYESRADAESKFIYALDKMEPVLNIYLDKGRTWRKNKVTLEMLETSKTPKIAIDPTVEKIFKELVQKLKEEEKSLFT